MCIHTSSIGIYTVRTTSQNSKRMEASAQTRVFVGATHTTEEKRERIRKNFYCYFVFLTKSGLDWIAVSTVPELTSVFTDGHGQGGGGAQTSGGAGLGRIPAEVLSEKNWRIFKCC